MKLLAAAIYLLLSLTAFSADTRPRANIVFTGIVISHNKKSKTVMLPNGRSMSQDTARVHAVTPDKVKDIIFSAAVPDIDEPKWKSVINKHVKIAIYQIDIDILIKSTTDPNTVAIITPISWDRVTPEDADKSEKSNP